MAWILLGSFALLDAFYCMSLVPLVDVIVSILSLGSFDVNLDRPIQFDFLPLGLAFST
jgi:ABC-type uncharacterized transport system permease subunit